MKTLKRAFVLVLVLALAISGIVAVSAIGHFSPDFEVSDNEMEGPVINKSDRPENANVEMHPIYVGEISEEEIDSTAQLGSESNPFKNLTDALNDLTKTSGTYQQYLKKISYDDVCNGVAVDGVEIILIGDTYEVGNLTTPQIFGGILTIRAEDGKNVTVHLGKDSNNKYNGNFLRICPNSSTYDYMEVNIGTADMASTGATLTFDATYFTCGDGQGIVYIGVASNGQNTILNTNMYDGVTIKNMGYDEVSGKITTKVAGNAIIFNKGTLKIYGGNFTQNYCRSIIMSANNKVGIGEGIFVYNATMYKNLAYALFTQGNTSAHITVYDITVENCFSNGVVWCNGANDLITVYGGLFKDVASNGVSGLAPFMGNNRPVIGENLKIQNEVLFTDLEGKEHLATKDFDKTPVIIKTRVFFAKDGSAYAYGYSKDYDILVRDGKVFVNPDDEFFNALTLYVDAGKYIYTVNGTNSCQYLVEVPETGFKANRNNIDNSVYYFGEKPEHNYVLVDSLAPTLTDEGYNEYQCTLCGDTYRDIIDALGSIDCEHEWKDSTVERTCMENGYDLRKCDKCGTEIKTNIIPARGGHNYIPKELLPTCQHGGYIDVTCEFGDFHEHTDYAQLDHNDVRELTYPTNIYRCVNGCNRITEKMFISYYDNMDTWSGNLAFDGKDPNAKYTAEVKIGQTIIIGKDLNGEDIGHQQDEEKENGKKFFGWFTADGTIYNYGDPVVVTSNLVLYEFYGYEVSNSSEFYSHLGYPMRLTGDIERTQTYNMNGASGFTIVDLNGYNITYSNGNAANYNAFTSQKVGLIFLGKGTINYQAANPDTQSFYETSFEGVYDTDQNRLVKSLWIGKDVTLITNTRLFKFTTSNALVPMIRIAGTVVAPYICDAIHANIEILPTANITLTNSSYFCNIDPQEYASSGLTVNVYGGTINLPENINESYFTANASGEEYVANYIFTGGAFNTSVPSEYLYKYLGGYMLYYNNMYSNKYFVIPNCTEEEHDFEKVSSDVTCTTAGHAVYECSHCGVQLVFDEDALGHTIDKLVEIIYPNGFDKVGDKVYTCSRCGKAHRTADGEAPAMLVAKGYSVANDATSIMGGYKVDYAAVDEYELVNGVKLEYGVLFVNVNDENVSEIAFDDEGKIIVNDVLKAIQAMFSNVLTDEEGKPYDSFNYKVSNFKPAEARYADLEIVIAAYIIEREESEEDETSTVKKVSFVQSNSIAKEKALDNEIYGKNISVQGSDTVLRAITLRRLYQNSDFAGNYNDYFTEQN